MAKKTKTDRKASIERARKIRLMIAKHPDWSSARVAEEAGVNPRVVYGITHNMRKKAKQRMVPEKPATTVAETATPSPVKMELEIPNEGIQLKVRNSTGMVGTLLITCKGVRYWPANSKNQPDRSISWDKLPLINTLLGG